MPLYGRPSAAIPRTVGSITSSITRLVRASVITGAGALPAKFVIHTAGPVMGEGREDEKIYRSFTSVLSLAAEKGLTSLALPAVSTGMGSVAGGV